MMTKNKATELRIALLQTDIIWEDIGANLKIIEDIIDGINEPVDLLLLPETFTTGFTMNVEDNADADMKTVKWMKQLAHDAACAISGTVIVKDGSLYYNRHYLVQTDGAVSYYDKRHLFRISREQHFFSSGDNKVVVRVGPFRILLQTCFDLRFPVFSRYQGDYDAIIYAANWPATRQYVWDTLLKARAIENQAYVIGINRSGIDGEDLAYAGGSCLVDPFGKVQECMKEAQGILILTMDINKVRNLRDKFPVYKDADTFTIEGM